MKRMSRVIISIFVLIFCTSCSAESTIREGTYLLQGQEESIAILPRVNIDGENIMFSYDLLSSYANIGGFIIDKNKLIMTTCDNRYTYVFEIDEDSLYFLEDESSNVSLTDPRFGYEIKDFDEFKFSDIIE